MSDPAASSPIRVFVAATADEFWTIASDRKAAVIEHGDRLLDFLKRCLRCPAPLSEPKDLAWFLASYAISI